MRTEIRQLACVVATVLAAQVSVRAQVIEDQVPEQARNLDVQEHLGERVPLDIELVNSEGRPVTLGDYFRPGRPVILVMGYYDCPLLCGLIFEGLARSTAALSFDVGEDYQVVVVSFDPTNTKEQAFDRKQTALTLYGREVTPAVRDGWAFHTTTDEDAHRLADVLGYQYRYVESNGEYAHGAVIMVVTPEGVLSRYLFPDKTGMGFSEKNLRLALLEASDGSIAEGIGDVFMHLCFSWDPDSDSYAADAFMIMRIGSAIGAVVLGGFIVWLKLGERRRADRKSKKDGARLDVSPMGRT